MSETLAEIFAKDPLSLTQSDIEAIIARMREARAQFELGAKTKVAERNTPAKRAKKAEDLLGQLGLSITGEEVNSEDDLKKLGLI
jgi:hypothetical protein